MNTKKIISQEIKDKVEALLSKMTLEEKIGQMTQYDFCNYNINSRVSDELRMEYEKQIKEGRVGSVFNIKGAEDANRLQQMAMNTRLGIPLIIGRDVIHGYKTIFPIPLAQACSWNINLIEKAAAISSAEAATQGIRWIFAPMVDVSREPRWGRVAEGLGEDTYLAENITRAMVRGFENNGGEASVVCCPKHYVAYGAGESGRDYNTVNISERVLRETYLPPFKAAIDEGALTIMSAFCEINGIPVCANKFLLTKVLREGWGFEGFVVSDHNAVYELLNHGIAASQQEACEKSIKAGLDMDMHSGFYQKHLPQLIAEGKVSEECVNQSVRRILAIKFLLGLFDHPYATGDSHNVILSKENIESALEMSRQSIVLLKNSNKLLPLDKNIKSIAVIGPLANDYENPLGCWAFDGNPENVVSVLDGIKARAGAQEVYYAMGCDIDSDSTDGIPEAVRVAEKAEVVILVVGESKRMSGEGHCRTSLGLPGVQEELVEAIYNTGKPVVVVLMNGRPLTIWWLDENVPAILEAWHLGIECGNAIADVIFGDYNPSGKLTVSFPRSVGQIPIYYDCKNTGRPPNVGGLSSNYIDSPVTPLYPFGYGLSYTEFEYSNLELSSKNIKHDESITVSVDVKNIGDMAGDEIVQLYIQDVAASITRPIKQLKGFERVSLNSGESKKVTFTLTPLHLSFYNEDMVFAVESGMFKVWVGSSSVGGLEDSFEVK